MSDRSSPLIVIAGATGDLGFRTARALVSRGARVRALLRPGTAIEKLEMLRTAAIEPLAVDLADAEALRRALAGAGGVVSTLNGLEPVIIGVQKRLLDAAVAADVPRFVPSDFALDFTRTRPGDNRNLDLRRRFMAMVDAAPIRATSVLNGAFLELLAGDAPLVMPAIRRVIHFGAADQKLDFTAKDDVAAFTAAAALDDEAPRILRIAGDSVSPADLAGIMTDITGRGYRPLRIGGIGAMSALIRVVRALTPPSETPFPVWQGMQYLRDGMSGRGKLHALDNDRYGKRTWRSARDVLVETYTAGPKR